jgi:hypothetical protein
MILVARYFNADLFEELFVSQLHLGNDPFSSAVDALQDSLVEDVVKVIRCKNCKNSLRETNPCGDRYCSLHKGYFDENAFCSYGERYSDKDE